jgi:hypothetical protein
MRFRKAKSEKHKFPRCARVVWRGSPQRDGLERGPFEGVSQSDASAIDPNTHGVAPEGESGIPEIGCAYHHSSQRRTAPDRRTTSARCPEAWSMLSLLSFDTSLQNLDCVLV